MATDDYREAITRLRGEAALRQQENLIYQAQAVADECHDIERQAVEASQAGDRDGALYLAELANQKEGEYLAIAAQLPRQPQQQFTDEEMRLLNQRAALANDPNYDRGHWLNQSKHGPAYHGGFNQAVVAAANTAAALGFQRGTQQFNDYVANAVDPVGFEPAPDPDEILKVINQTSKYCDASRGGKPLTAKQYNKFVEPAQEHVATQLRAAGKL